MLELATTSMIMDQPRLQIADAVIWNADKVKFRIPGFAMVALTTAPHVYREGHFHHGGIYLSWFLKIGKWMTAGWYPKISRL